MSEHPRQLVALAEQDSPTLTLPRPLELSSPLPRQPSPEQRLGLMRHELQRSSSVFLRIFPSVAIQHLSQLSGGESKGERKDGTAPA